MMIARKIFGLLIVLLSIVLTFLAPTGASAVTCPEGEAQTYYINPDQSINLNGTFCVKAGLLAKPSKCITKTGEIDCYEFAYTINAKTVGESLSQVNLLIPSKKLCTLSLFSTDRSQKIREYEPSTGFSATDLNTDVITWDALKLDSSNKSNINTFIATLCGTSPSTMQLKTATGVQYVGIDGPACCGVTQAPTQLSYGLNVPGGQSGTLEINYQLCTYLPISDKISYTSGEVKQNLEEVPGLAYCYLNDRTNWFDSKLCTKIKKFGPREGAPIFTKKMLGPPIAYECVGGICKGFAYYGFGSKIYRATADVPEFYTPGTCSDTKSNAPIPEEVVIDSIFKFVPSGCGGSVYELVNGEWVLIAGPGLTKSLYLVPYSLDGSLNFVDASEFVSTSETGMIFSNGWCCTGGYCYTCPR